VRSPFTNLYGPAHPILRPVTEPKRSQTPKRPLFLSSSKWRQFFFNRSSVVLFAAFRHSPLVTVAEAKDARSAERFLLRALLVSLLLHCLVFGVWKVGQNQGWWTNLELPRWMQLLSKALLPPVPKKPAQMVSIPPSLFVQTDPEMIAPQAPKETKYYGANNTVAANKEIKTPSNVPDLDGHQEKVMKTTEAAQPKAVPLQPTPPPQPQPIQAQATPKKSSTPGDLALARPAKKVQDTDGKADAALAPQPQPQPAYERPHTIAEAMARNGTLGEKARQDGGVNRLAMNSALDVQGSPIGAYDALFIAAVQARWYQLLENRTANAPGKVVVEFRMHPDGRITDLKVTQNEVTELLSMICQQAILDPAPFPPWPRQMRLDIPADYRDVQFTFFYDLE
jgi:outer membrane biosynthesis protein TonB